MTGFDVQLVCQTANSLVVTESLALDSVEFCYSPVDIPKDCDTVYVQVCFALSLLTSV